MTIQPQDMIWVSFGTFFSLAQPYLIILYPFWNRLAYKKSVVIAAALAIVLSFTAVFILLPSEMITFSFLQMWRLSMFGPAALFCFVFIGKDRAKVMYFFLIIATLFVACIKLANHIIWTYFDNANYIDFTIVHTVMHIITTPLLMIYINRLAKRTVPVVEPSGNRIWKIVWAVPTLFLMINVAFNHRFDPEVIVTQAFVISNILSIAGILVTSEILFRSLQITAETETAKREAEEARLNERELSLEKNALERVNNLKTELTRTVSHEMRTPLAVIMGFAEITAKDIRNMGIESMAADNLDALAAEAHRMTVMLEELSAPLLIKEFSKDKRVVMPDASIRQIAGLYEKILERKNVRLLLDLPEQMPAVYANEHEMTQVMFNLLRNADRHTESGEIAVSAVVADNEITFTVTDTGTGIDPELLPRVFERGTSGEKGGMGFGLSICRDIIEAHGGRIWIDSEPGNGATASFTLPVYKGENTREE